MIVKLCEVHNDHYANKLDLTKALMNKERCIELLVDRYGYYGPFTIGGFYLLPDGTVIKSINHLDIDKFLIKKGYIKSNLSNNETLQFGDGSQFMDAVNAVRVRRRPGNDWRFLPYVVLPKDSLTNIQYDKLTEFLDLVLATNKEIQIETYNNTSKVYKAWDGYSSDDIIKNIKRFYTSGQLT